jgi:hypothetical protein
MESTRVLAASVTPVVLISAGGLITLALYNRLAAILIRLRACHQQYAELLGERGDGTEVRRSERLAVASSQIGKITHKAKVVRRSLYCLLASIVAFLGCSLFAAASVLDSRFGAMAVAAYVLGLLSFGSGIGWAIRELALSIAPLDEMNAYLDAAMKQAGGSSAEIDRLDQYRSDDAPFEGGDGRRDCAA